MMKRRTVFFGSASLIVSAALVAGCASKFLKYEKAEELKEIKEFDQKVKIETPAEPEESPSPEASPTPPASVETTPTPVPAKPTPTPAPRKDKKEKRALKAKPASAKHEPELEGQAGFIGRRPIQDPFRVGEKVRHEVSYFNVKAGELVLAVKPFAQVNGRKNYHFYFGIKTSTLFSSFYSVDDYVSSLVDFETMVPSVYTMHVKETSKLQETRFFIDWSKLHASFWEKKVTKKDGPEETKKEWDVLEYSQDVFSSAFYLRVFPWAVGDEHAFRVTDNAENLIFRGKALRREKLSTSIGDFQAIVIKPDIELRGQFKPVGDIFIWISDDDRKLILRIECKIKIGTLVSEIVELSPGKLDESP
jgi:hypothetical protein